MAGKQPLDAALTTLAGNDGSNLTGVDAETLNSATAATYEDAYNSAAKDLLTAKRGDIYSSRGVASTSPGGEPLTAAGVFSAAGISSDAFPAFLTSAEFDDLTEYENKIYVVNGVGTYFGGRLMIREPVSFGGSDIHVAKTGDDSTGDGSEGNPYLTISKAWDSASTSGGITVWIHEGTYAENNGSGYFLKTAKAFTSEIVFRAVPGEKVIWTNASGAYVMRLNGSQQNVTFRDIEFRGTGAETDFVISTGTSNFTNMKFVECRFIDTSDTLRSIRLAGLLQSSNFRVLRNEFRTNGPFTVFVQNTSDFRAVGNYYYSTDTTSRFVDGSPGNDGDFYINSNVIDAGSASTSAYGVLLDNFGGEGSVVFRGNKIETTGRGIIVQGGDGTNPFTIDLSNNLVLAGASGITLNHDVTGGTISRNRIHAGIGNPGGNGWTGLGCPADANTGEGNIESVTISDNYSRSDGGHALLVSVNSDGIILSGNVADASNGADHAMVIKGANHVLTRNRTYGGFTSSLYLKGADDCTITGHWAEADSAASSAFNWGIETDMASPTPTGNSVTDSVFVVKNGALFGASGATDIGSGNNVDRNAYTVAVGESWGSMNGVAVTSLAEVRTRWNGISGSTGKDANSYEDLAENAF